MKLTAGIGSITSYEKMVSSGASEVFMGYVPLSWSEKYGNVLPLNRREVFFYHIQTTTLEDMKILKKMVDVCRVPVVITMNALTYTREQLQDLLNIIKDLGAIGFHDFIISDLNLIRFLFENEVPCNIHVSGELGEWNHPTIQFLLSEFHNSVTKIKRIIFHRKVTLSDMKVMIEETKKLDPSIEFEAFFMNEKCHYTGGFCNSLHCDEMVHLCQLPYQLSSVHENDEVNRTFLVEETVDSSIVGFSGCGLCAISKLKEIGITHLKIVGRGLPEGEMVQCLSYVRRAMNLSSKKEIQALFKKSNCSKNCYYIE